MADFDLAARIGGRAPLCDRRGQGRGGEPLLRHDADQRAHHGFGHGEAGELRVDTDAGRVAFSDHAAIVKDDHCLGPSKRRLLRLLEGVIERGFQRGIRWLDHIGTGNVGQQRRRLRCLKRNKIAPEQIWLLRSMDQHTAKTFVKLGMVCEQPGGRGIDSLCRGVEPVAQKPPQRADAGAICRLREHL
jgi:hypothetical protein